ncbi:MAG: hypothetical protein AAF571_13025 [Verrucomicrobiota bacterium]
MRFLLLTLLVCAGVLFTTGCASSEKKSNREKISQTPWNRPADWEGKGVLGGIVQ